MSDPDAGAPNPYNATTDFEKKSHEAMLAMVDDADSGEVTRLGNKLKDAETKLNEIGEALKTHMGRLNWESEAGDAFREWGTKVASSTLSLADYTGTAGTFMVHAGTVLGEVQKAMPKVPTEAKKIATAYEPGGALDPSGTSDASGYAGLASCPTPEAVAKAKSQVEDARQEAARQMVKLGQAYNMSTDIMKASDPPTFPPAPKEAMPPRPDGFRDSVEIGGVPGSGSPRYTSHEGHRVTTAVDASPSSSSAITSVGSRKHSAESLTTTHIDSVAPPTTHHPEVGSVATSFAAPAAVSNNPINVGMLPSETFRPSGTVTPGPVGDVARPPGVIGGSQAPRLPSVTSGSGVSRPSVNEGIIGGRPANSSSTPHGQIPRGTVVGTERGVAPGRPPMSGAPGSGAVGGTGGSSPHGITGARRLASEPGGEVGIPRGSDAPSGRTFTAGGSGLATRRGENATAVHSTTGSCCSGAARGGVPAPHDELGARPMPRPDYLCEDEETWTSWGRNVPPVVE